MTDELVARRSEPPRKKRKLHLVKCDRCREDKQKCLPIARVWPDRKCDRCIEKDFPCSEGSLAGRRSLAPTLSDDRTALGVSSVDRLNLGESESLPSREDAVDAVEVMMRYLHGQGGPASSLSSGMRKDQSTIEEAAEERRTLIETLSEGEKRAQSNTDKDAQSRDSQPGTDLFPDFAFLLSYHTLVEAAMKRLRELEADTLDFFHLELDKDTLADLVDGTGCQKFDTLNSQLQVIALRQASEVLITPNHRQKSAGFSALMGKFFALCPLDNNAKCSICDETDYEMLLLKKYAQTEDIGSEFMMRQRRLMVHYQKTNHVLLHEIDQEAVETEWFRYIELLFEIDSKASNLLAKLDLLDHAAFLKQTLVLPLPDELGIWGDKLNLLRSQPDCLGRTELHFYLDASSAERLREEGLMQRALQRQFYDNADLLGRTPLHLACLKENEGMVHELLRAGANPRTPTIFGHTPLHYAAASKSLPICRELLEQDRVDVNWMDKLGNSSLFYAVQTHNEEMVNLLLRNDEIDPDWSAAEQYPTPLLKAIQCGSETIVRLLLQSGANSNQAFVSAFEGYSALHYAILHRRIGILKILLDCSGIFLNVQDKLGATPLCMAVEADLTEAVDQLLSSPDVDVNAKNYRTEDTALMMTAVHDHVGVCLKLLGHANIQVNSTNAAGETALIKAVRLGRTEIVQSLLADPRLLVNTQDAEGRTALLEAVENRRSKESGLLLDQPDIDVNKADKRRKTALSQAARQDYHELLQELLRHSEIDVNIQGEDDRTALHEAARKGALNATQALLGHPSINVSIENKYGHMAYIEAIRNGHTEVYRILLEHQQSK